MSGELDEKGLGALLQQRRRQAGLTQQELCQAANLSYSTLAKIERGAIKAPSIFTIQSIAAALSTSLDELLGSSTPDKRYEQSNSGIKFVYFDVNGCLVTFYQTAAIQIAKDYGLLVDVVEAATLHFSNAICSGVMTLDEFNIEMANRLGIPSLDWASYYLRAAEPLAVMQETLAWAAQHYRIGLITNIVPGMLDELINRGKVPTLPYDAVIDSSRIGLLKPDEAIYRYAVEQAGVQPSEILLVDDTQINVVNADKYGWQAVQFDYGRAEDSAQYVRQLLAFDESR